MKSIDDIWETFKNMLVRVGTGITGKTFPIVDISPHEDELGYTDKSGTIHLTKNDPIMDDMDLEHRLIFIKGVYGHELMHQLDTNFAALEKAMSKLPYFEQEIFLIIFNVMEDPAIEYWASYYFSGHLLRALKYCIMTLYKNGPSLEKSDTPFEQFLNAYIQYGDGGFLKGEFTFKEAKEYFFKALPFFDKAIEEPVGAKRVDYAKEVFDLTKPLWINEAKNAENFEKFRQLLNDLLEKYGKSAGCSGGLPLGDEEKEKPDAPDTKAEKRTIVLKGLEEELGSGMAGAASEPAKTGEAEDLSNSEDGAEQSEITDEDIEKVKNEIKKLHEEADKQKRENQFSVKIDECTSDLVEKYPRAKCSNNVSLSDMSIYSVEYEKIVADMQSGIHSAVSQLKRLFANDTENTEHKTSGRVNVNRLVASKKTARVFDKRVMPANKSNIAIELLVDVSGSMHGDKIKLARNAAIGLAEVFGKLKIKTKVMAFTADIGGYEAVHYHYLNWHNTQYERLKLLEITARCNNFDGYSIRYAGKEIGKRHEEHKIIIVISDGSPACQSYRTNEQGVADTSDAIREASKAATVIGVAIDADASVLQKMYGKHFIYINNTNELFSQIVRLIRKEIASW